MSARAHLLKSLFTRTRACIGVCSCLYCGVSVAMVSAGVSGVRKLDTFESSFVRLPFDSQSSEQSEYKEVEFSNIIGPTVDSMKNLEESLCLKDSQTINKRPNTLVGPSLEPNLGWQLSKLALDDKKEQLGVEGNVLEQNLVLLREAKLDVILNDILRA